MKATKQFAKVIGEYIEKAKQEDELFAKCVDSQPSKTIQGCVNYILKTVKDSGVAGWTDDEIFGMARHFYDEKELKDPGDQQREQKREEARAKALMEKRERESKMQLDLFGGAL